MNLRRVACLASALLAGCATAPSRDYVQRVETLALLQTFNADLLGHDSATLTLERWCGEHRLADPARIVAHRVAGADKPMPAELRAQLRIGADEPLRYRRVQLACGEHVLSEADNWYVPARLSADMNRRLDETEEPFGKVVKPLGFTRHTLLAMLLWNPLPAGWELAPPRALRDETPVPHELLRHQAVLVDAAQVPFSVVVETYTSELLAFPR